MYNKRVEKVKLLISKKEAKEELEKRVTEGKEKHGRCGAGGRAWVPPRAPSVAQAQLLTPFPPTPYPSATHRATNMWRPSQLLPR